MSLEWNIFKNDEFWVSRRSEFQIPRPTTDCRDVRTYGMARTIESGELAETECDGKERIMNRPLRQVENIKLSNNYFKVMWSPL